MGKKSKSNKKWNNDKCWREYKDNIWNPATCSCENGKYLANITDDSVITCHEIKDGQTNFQQILIKKCNL